MFFRRWILLTTIALTVGCTAVPAVKPAPLPPPPTTAQAGSTTIVAVAPPAQPCCKMTLPEWLGITGLFRGIGRLIAGLPPVLNYFIPGVGTQITEMGTVPPVLPLNAAANLMSPNPAVRAAAEIKQEEDGSAQKIKALEYLATIGCSNCYPGVESALLAGLEDCTESVRFAAVKALSDAAGQPCRSCQGRNCCSVKVLAKLHQMGYETTDQGCAWEMSPRVRRQARLAMTTCGGQVRPSEIGPPLEGPAALPPQPASPISNRTPQTGGLLADGKSPHNAAEAAANPFDEPSADSVPRIASQDSLAQVVAQWLRPSGQAVDEVELASVNDESIRMADLQPALDDLRSRLPADQPPAVRSQVLAELVRVELERAIDRTLLCQAARAAGGAASGVQVADYSEESPAGAARTVSADDENGTQTDEELAASWLREQVHVENEVSETDVLAHYHAHFARFGESGSVRYEQLSAKFEKFPNEAAARAALAVVQRRIRGEAVEAAELARMRGVTSGKADWTRREDLSSDAVAEALFRLPIGQPGEIVADKEGLHILRVLERQPLLPEPAPETTERIESQIRRQRYAEARREYLRTLREQARIRTIAEGP